MKKKKNKENKKRKSTKVKGSGCPSGFSFPLRIKIGMHKRLMKLR